MRTRWIAVGVAVLLVLAAALIFNSILAAEEPTAQAPERPEGSVTPTENTTPETGAVSPTIPPVNPENPTPPDLRDQSPPRGAEREFSTDFSRHTISYDEVLSGGPPKDGIPAIDDPRFIGVEEADTWLKPNEPVVLLQLGDDARAYPLRVLTWHEIVNDVVDDTPVVVTFCPLCNTAIAFERTFDGQVLDFGTTGRLRFSNLIMYDRQTETWWQQASGEGLAGRYAGEQLTFLPAALIAWEDFKEAHPDGQVLSRQTGYSRPYGQNPYTGYDDINSSPFLYRGPDHSDRLPPMARVLTLEIEGQAVAYPFELLSEEHVVNDEVAGRPVVVFWEAGTASALDQAALSQGRDVGSANSFSRELEGRTLTFEFDGERIVDQQTGSEWNVLGRAVSGELAGSRLEPVVGVNHFWFSWAAFKPDTRIYQS